MHPNNTVSMEKTRRHKPRLTFARVWLLGTLTVGTLDILSAMVFFDTRGVPPVRILQSIASGLLGGEAYEGGVQTALLGGALHFAIAAVIVAVYFLASRRFSGLARHPVRYGAAYGVLVYIVMTFVVVPLSAAVVGPTTLPAVIHGLSIHVLGVGIPCALWARLLCPTISTVPRTIQQDRL